jgi:haloalkane dehalogenase
MAVADLISAHRAAGRDFEAAGVKSFALDQGDGAAIVLVHGVPTCSYLYRKIVPPLAADGFRAVAFDFPGLGFAERPEQFDYSWGGLARWMGDALDALEIERCHLVVHDIGGPIGCEWAVRNPERVISLTALNIMLEVADFRRPWFMHLFVPRGVGELWLRGMNRFAMATLFAREGLGDRSAVSRDELGAYYDLLKRGDGSGDGGRAFLRIMRGFELTEEKERLLVDGLAKRDYPAQIVWGRDDAALNPAREGVERAIGEKAQLIAGKHFIQEDQAPTVAEAVAGLASSPS